MDLGKLNCNSCDRPLSVFLAGTKFFNRGRGVQIVCPNCKEVNTFNQGVVKRLMKIAK